MLRGPCDGMAAPPFLLIPSVQGRPFQSLGASDDTSDASMGVIFPESNQGSTSSMQCDLESLAFPF